MYVCQFIVSVALRSLISCRVEIAGEAASLHCLGQLMGELVAERTAKQTWATELRNIHRRIENFTALSVRSLYYLLIHVLTGFLLFSKRNSLSFSCLLSRILLLKNVKCLRRQRS